MSDTPDFDELMEMLRHPRDWRVRSQAVVELSEFDTPEAMQALLAALYDESPHVAQLASWKLRRFGSDAVPGLLEVLHSGVELAAPRFIVLTLGDIRDRRVVNDLIQLLNHEDSSLREAAMLALQHMPDRNAVSPLLRLLETEDEYSKHTVAQTLGEIGDPAAIPGLRELLFSSEQATRSFAAAALGKINDEAALEALLEAARSEQGEVRCSVAHGLGYKRDSRAFDCLVAQLQDEHPLARAGAVRALAKVDGTRAAPHIVKLLDDPDQTVQNSLNKALGYLSLDIVPVLMRRLRRSDLARPADGLYQLTENYWRFDERGNAAVEEALEAVTSSTEQNQRVVAVWLLRTYCGVQISRRRKWEQEDKPLPEFEWPELYDRVINAIVILLGDPGPDIRLCAVEALYTAPDKRAVEGLIRCLEDEDPFVAQKAAEILGRIGDERAVPGLVNLLDSPEKMPRLNAMAALAWIGGETAVEMLITMLDHPDASTRERAAHNLGMIGDQRVVPVLLEKLKTEAETEARESIAYSLGLLHDRRATPALTEILTNTSDRSWPGRRLRTKAASALRMLRDEAALPALFEAVNTAPEWQVRMGAVEALGVIGTPQERTDRLFGFLGHENDTVRTTAAERLGYLGARSEDLDLRDYIVSHLIMRLQDTGIGYHATPRVAHMAAKSLYYVGTTEAIEVLKTWELKQQNSQENKPE